MTDHFLPAALAFAVLVGGTAAIGSELLSPRLASAPAMRIVQLERVVVTGQRIKVSAPLASAGPTQPAVQQLQ